jgi:hypothetical protein
VKSGYRRTFVPGLPASPASQAPGAPFLSRGIRDFAYVAVPESAGKTGVRGFCGDSSGRICYTTNGTAPLGHGQCDAECTDLQ